MLGTTQGVGTCIHGVLDDERLLVWTAFEVVVVDEETTLELIVLKSGVTTIELVSTEDGVALEPVPDVDIGVEVTAGTTMVTVSYTV